MTPKIKWVETEAAPLGERCRLCVTDMFPKNYLVLEQYDECLILPPGLPPLRSGDPRRFKLFLSLREAATSALA